MLAELTEEKSVRRQAFRDREKAERARDAIQADHTALWALVEETTGLGTKAIRETLESRKRTAKVEPARDRKTWPLINEFEDMKGKQS